MHVHEGQLKDLYILLGLKEEPYILPKSMEQSYIFPELKEEPYILPRLKEQPYPPWIEGATMVENSPYVLVEGNAL